MCRCYTTRCCCGCTDMKTGIKIMTAIDLIFYFIVFGTGIGTGWLGMFGWHGYRYAGLVILVFIADILLLLGVGMRNGCLIAFWQAIKILNIILLFMGWIVIPLTVYLCVIPRGTDEAGECPYVLDYPDYYTGVLGLYILWGGVFLAFLILPIYYIYFWIVVNSYRKDIMS